MTKEKMGTKDTSIEKAQEQHGDAAQPAASPASKITPQFWEAVHRVCQRAKFDLDVNVREQLIAAGHQHGLTIRELIDAKIIDEPATPRPGQLKGGHQPQDQDSGPPPNSRRAARAGGNQ